MAIICSVILIIMDVPVVRFGIQLWAAILAFAQVLLLAMVIVILVVVIVV